ncbi:MAG: formylglycine-generating enzyme family protein [Rhodospirillales bacterium]|nr:formylglycine-generating enzyme family protein [Rhodospirillales bacterium]
MGVLAAMLTLWGWPAHGGPRYVHMPGGRFASALAAPDGRAATVLLRPFWMRAEPVTNAEFLAFVRSHPEWRRGRVFALFAGPHYLASWAGALRLGPQAPPDAPVTEVSWFAARAYCASEGATLPTWYQWEYAAAADTSRRDARAEPARNAAILAAVMASTGQPPGMVGCNAPNVYGVSDLNRLLWEWTEDYAAMFPSADARNPGTGASLALCGGSALAFHDRTQYALIMRVAALAALQPSGDAPRVGFRCVRD